MNLIISFIICLLGVTTGYSEENFIVSNGHETIFEMGPHLDEQTTPACSFNIALSLIGFATGVLTDENRPVWEYKEGYDNTYETWRQSQSPQTWMKYSAVWYSRIIAAEVGLEKIQEYLALFNYGNQDFSGGLTKAWISSSLKISPREQLHFVEKIVNNEHCVCNYTLEKTKSILFKEEFSNGWKLYGKTGLGSFNEADGSKTKVGWLVGWIEKDNISYPFAYNIRAPEINDQRVLRVKQLLTEVNLIQE